MVPIDPVIGGFAAAVDRLHEAASDLTGLDDFGDTAYLAPLQVLLQAYDTDSRLTPVGRTLITEMIVRTLRNRLRVVHGWRALPDALLSDIAKPVFILGLPRTGTTALHHLLSFDANHQVLQNWIGNAPQPRPPRAAWHANPDHQQAVRELEAVYATDPSLKAMHFVTADGPDECRLLFLQTFVDDTFDSNATVPSYHQWRLGLDMRPVYRWHRDQLKLIGSNEPSKRWILKDPPHMRWIDTLLETYPDACIVHTHRDPGKVVPSLCSLVSGFRVAFEGPPRGDEDYDWLVEHYLTGVVRTMNRRAAAAPAQFLDVQFNDLVARPIETIEAVYDHFGMHLAGATVDLMRRWHAENTKGEHGEHVYRAESFGLSAAAVRERFSAYIAAYAVPTER